MRLLLGIVAIVLTLMVVPPAAFAIRRYGEYFFPTSGVRLLPAPWLVPKQPGGLALHIAMVHDILHQRFLIHGPAFFTHRQQQAEAELAADESDHRAPDERYWALLDDVGVGCERLGRPLDGIAVLRRKLALQQPPAADGHRLQPTPSCYSTYANLGTLLVHANMKAAQAKDPVALAAVREGQRFVIDAMTVNPDAHFGREAWQALLVSYLLQAIERPALVQEQDFLGISTQHFRPESVLAHRHYGYVAYSRQLDEHGMDEGVAALAQPARSPDLEQLAEDLRQFIPSLQDANGWIQSTEPALGRWSKGGSRVDAPILGIVGLWTLGGGPNPHLCLALAHLMEAMHQRRIAWDAYERAVELSDRLSSDPAIRASLVYHCQQRQQAIAKDLQESGDELRARHRQELDYGQGLQREFAIFEEQQIATGSGDSAERAFRASHPHIASEAGDEDMVAIQAPHRTWEFAALWGGGLSTLVLIALLLRPRAKVAAAATP